MIQVSINRTCARLQTTEPLTSGMIGKQMQLVFDSSWNGLRKTAVFFDGKNAVSLMDSFWDGNTITIPHEVLTEAGRTVTMGVYGYKVNGDETMLAIPSVYAELGKVRKGADPEADPTADPTLPVYAQLEWKIDHFEVPEEQIAEQVQEYLDEHPIEIQPATETVLGAVKVGDGLSVTPDGTLSADSIDAYTKAETDALLDGKADAADIPSLDGYATESYVQNYHDNTKQDAITDLASIRSGAALGATSVQPDEDGNIVLEDAGVELKTNAKGVKLTGSNPDGTPFLIIEDVNNPDEPVVIAGVAEPRMRDEAVNKGYVDDNYALKSDLDDYVSYDDTEEAETLQIDNAVTSGSNNLITSGAVAAAGYLTLATLPRYNGEVE